MKTSFFFPLSLIVLIDDFHFFSKSNRILNMNHEELEDFMLNQAHLWLDEGYIFGTGGAGFERFNVACPRSTLKQALEQLEKAIKE